MISVTFQGVVFGVAIAAVLLTTILVFATKSIKNPVISFIQNFCGILFVFSGMVKAIDPLGTAYKMQQYFAEFHSTFQDTAFQFISGLFPFLSEISVAFSVFVIILEIIIGVMFIIGARIRLATWLFLLIMILFTVLTGFTFLTGYVPSGVNFFQFAKWGPYMESNMKVTDCGCFGDFLKIKPKLSFFKDVALMLPALIFIYKRDEMHQLLTTQSKNFILAITTLGLVWYCLSNFAWNLPQVDFRPFREGVDLREQRKAELESAAAVRVTGFRLKNKSTGQFVELSSDVYLAEMTTKYPREVWEVVEQIKTKPAIEPTKISEFVINDADGWDISEDLLNEKEASLWIISHEVPYIVKNEQVEVVDTTYQMDTVELSGSEEAVHVVRSGPIMEKRMVNKDLYIFEENFSSKYKDKLLPLIDNLDIPAYAFVGGLDRDKVVAFKDWMNIKFTVYEADDILLKTIIRSNPGLVLMKDGVIIKKWHISKLPDAAEVTGLIGSGSSD